MRATVFFENVHALALASSAIDTGVFRAPFGSDSTVIPLVAGKDAARSRSAHSPPLRLPSARHTP
ncbi:hypothetical protein [Flindersiella endophytica]